MIWLLNWIFDLQIRIIDVFFWLYVAGIGFVLWQSAI